MHTYYNKIFKKNLVELSSNNNYNDAINEWTFLKLVKGSGNCICTKNIIYNYHLKNKINDNRIIVGSVHIKLFERTDFNNIVRYMNYEFPYGKYKNHKLRDILIKDPSYIEWLIKSDFHTPRKFHGFKKCLTFIKNNSAVLLTKV